MNNSKIEIMNDLLKVLDKMIAMEEKEGKKLFSDEVYMHLSYTMENVSGVFGTTNKSIIEFRPEFFKSKN